MSKPHILIIDDEPDIRELLAITLKRMDTLPHSVANLQAAKEALLNQSYQLCLTDMRLPDGNGIDLVKYVQQSFPQLPIAVITAFGSVETAIAALKAGAFDFVTKPIDLKKLRGLIQSALKLSIVTEKQSSINFIGNSKGIQELRLQITKLARSQAPVHISGESGSGKELVARLIHAQGHRNDKPFVAVNCGAIPTELMESEFFGHTKGSFTGATTDKLGLFQAAESGTLFLDEVADLPLHMQVKLLRAIQEKAIRPIGSQQEIPTDVRIISATHKDLAAEIKANNFRQDLYYRINVIEIKVPSLRERSEDIPLLTEHILARLGNTRNMKSPQLSTEAKQALLKYLFPGNIRELENILERAFTLCEDDLIDVEHLQLPIIPENQAANLSASVSSQNNLEDFLEQIEKKVILEALEYTDGNKTAAAKKLGISFRAFRYRLKKLGLE